MATVGACHVKKCARVFAERRWRSNEDWMARTGYASAAAISACAIAQRPCNRPQVLAAYGLQDSRNEEQNQKTKSNPNTTCLQITLGENHGTGHFYLAKNRTFLLCVDRRPPTFPHSLHSPLPPLRRPDGRWHAREGLQAIEDLYV